MEDAKREKVIDKIRKLLNLSNNNDNQNEAVRAALAAQRLIADYDVTDNELNKGSEVPVKLKSEIGEHSSWRFTLAVIVADNFRCRAYTNTYIWKCHNGKKTSETSVTFYGYELDAQAARMTYERLYKVGNRLGNKAASEYRARYGTARGVYNTFTLGFAYGVKAELEKQCQELALVVPPEVSEYVDSMDAKKQRRGGFSADADSYINGRVAGMDAVRAGRVDDFQDYLLEA